MLVINLISRTNSEPSYLNLNKKNTDQNMFYKFVVCVTVFLYEAIWLVSLHNKYLAHRIQQPISKLQILTFPEPVFDQSDYFWQKTQSTIKTCKTFSNWPKKCEKFGFIISELVVGSAWWARYLGTNEFTPTPWLTLLLVLGKSCVNQKSR